MKNAKFFFDKYGIRFGVAFVTAAVIRLLCGTWDALATPQEQLDVIQFVRNHWDWADFAGQCTITGLVVAASYPIEALFSKRAKYAGTGGRPH